LTIDTLTINRGGSDSPFSSNSFSQAVSEKREDGSVTLHIYVDKCSLEAFSGDYTAAGTILNIVHKLSPSFIHKEKGRPRNP